MKEIRLDRVSIFRDQLSFLIPHEWIESEEDGKNYLYHSPGARSGWFRVSLLSITNSDGLTSEGLQNLLAERAEREGGVLYKSNDNIIAAWEQASEEDGIPIVNFGWIVGHHHELHLSHEAMFSYTILKEKRDHPETQRMVQLLLELVAGTKFADVR